MTMVGADGAAVVEAYRPSWYHGTSKAALKNPWARKKKKQIKCELDDEEIFELARIAVLAIQNRRATGVSARTSSSSRMGTPVCPTVH